MGDMTVWVRRNWNDSAGMSAEYRLSDTSGWHWDDIAGGDVSGFARRSPRLMPMGYVMCDGAINGQVSHSCRHGQAPHRIKVVMVAKDNSKSVVAAVRELADVNRRR